MDAQSIADTLLMTVQNWGLDTSCLVAQGYDGASVMSSGLVSMVYRPGLRKFVLMHATYVHCRSCPKSRCFKCMPKCPLYSQPFLV